MNPANYATLDASGSMAEGGREMKRTHSVFIEVEPCLRCGAEITHAHGYNGRMRAMGRKEL